MDPFVLVTLLSFAASVIGVCVSFFARRIPSRGWVGVVFLVVTALVWMLIEPRESSGATNWPMFLMFFLIAPTAAVYSFRTRKHAPDRLPALAAFVGSFIIIGLTVFMLFSLVILIYAMIAHGI